MSGPDEAPNAPDRLPDGLVERLDSLEIPELEAVLRYVERRIDSLRTPIAEEIVASASGEIIDVEDHGTYALVWKRIPAPEESGVDTDTVSLFHVSREKHLDGEESLHWAYLGDVRSTAQVRCRNCGRALDGDVTVCPHCGSDDVGRSERED